MPFKDLQATTVPCDNELPATPRYIPANFHPRAPAGRELMTAYRLALILVLASNAAAVAADSPPKVDFGRDIQPILSENCFFCHGPDEKNRQANLRLDTFAGATAGDAIVPGKSAESELLRRILSNEPSEVMPPPKAKRKLTAAQKALLARWIDGGAEYAKHWAFVAPVRPATPAASQTAVIHNPIDSFVVRRLTEEGLSQAPPASPEKLLRRVTLDLTGLPPTLEELDAFLEDPSDRAYNEAVDRLLGSPRFGERMVWEWLDAARYADTNGYQGDPTRPMWYWRDWAIDALNANLPFDRFTIEQLAGDLLPDPTRNQLIATGFHRNHMINGEGGRIAEESRVEYVQDRVETTGTVWMGLTLTCCRCHDHKYDSFTQKEYYQLAAYFNSLDESGANDAGGLANPVLSMPSRELEERIAGLTLESQAAERELEAVEKRIIPGQSDWERSLTGEGGRLREPRWSTLDPREMTTEQETTLTRLDDGSVRAEGKRPPADEYRLTCNTSLSHITALRLEALPDDALPAKGPGRAENGNFVLSELTLDIDGQAIPLEALSADFSQQGWDRLGAFDGNQSTGWAIHPETGKPHALVFSPKTPLTLEKERSLRFRLSFRYGTEHTLGRFRLSVTDEDRSLVTPMPAEIRDILAKDAGQRSAAELQALTRHYRETNADYRVAARKRDDLRKTRDEAARQAPRTMVMRDRLEPRETFVLEKGAYNVPRDKVEHGVPAVLSPLPANAPRNRLALAGWLISRENPLTARVTVNRLWQQFFGTGLVKSAEDFGVQGDKPSHPELLDWLAVEFMSPTVSGDVTSPAWDTKHIVRLIVTSATYRQSSRVSQGMAERDPENRLLARGPRYRLPSWMLRDQALAISGLLVEKQGGPPVRGYQPPGVWEDATFGQIRYEPDHGESLYRRSLYTFWRRIVAPTVFFDVANRQNCTVKSGRTNTPLHALVTLNDVTYVEAARALAERTLAGTGRDDNERIDQLFRRCTARSPVPREQSRLLSRLSTLRAAFAADPENARRFVATGESKPDASVPVSELAAWTGIASLVLNLDETLSKE
jgi:mono/diheme cytochrome c family protein